MITTHESKWPPETGTFGVSLARRVMRSRLYHQLSSIERAECDTLLGIGGLVNESDVGAEVAAQRAFAKMCGQLEGFEAEVFAKNSPHLQRKLCEARQAVELVLQQAKPHSFYNKVLGYTLRTSVMARVRAILS